MYVRIRDGGVAAVELRIYEPPRFFEALLRGRDFREAPDITSRICGICPIAYQTSAINAIEDAFGVVSTSPLRELRRLIYCGEWIESHALHVLMLHAPDFLGYESGIALARDHPDLVRPDSQLKKTGNRLVTVAGGREIHPVNLRVGGFYRVPTRRELAALRDELERGREIALSLTRWAAGFTFPDFEQDYEFVAMSPARGLPDRAWPHRLERGPRHRCPRVRRALRRGARRALQRPALAGCASATPTCVGPMARFALNADRLSPLARDAAAEVGLDATACREPVPQHPRALRRARLRLRRGAAADRALQPPERPAVDGRAPRGDRLRLQRGAARAAVPPLRASTRTA